MENKKTSGNWASIVAILLTFGIVLMSFGLMNLYDDKPTTIKLLQVEDEKPTYEYLKSITVEITGYTSDYISIFEEEYYNYYEEVGEELRGWGGTGVVIKRTDSETYVLTNAHVAGKEFNDKTLYIKEGDKEIEAEIVKYHSTLDLAVLKIPVRMKKKQAVHGFAVSKPQDDIYVVGHHLGRPYIYGEGVFAGYDGIFDVLQLPCLYGNSGSGVINKDGKLVAVVFAISMYNWFGGADVAHAIAVDGLSVEMFLDRLDLLN